MVARNVCVLCLEHLVTRMLAQSVTVHLVDLCHCVFGLLILKHSWKERDNFNIRCVGQQSFSDRCWLWINLCNKAVVASHYTTHILINPFILVINTKSLPASLMSFYFCLFLCLFFHLADTAE